MLLRDIVINESVGLAQRRPGDRWMAPDGKVLYFKQLDFYPESGRFSSPEEMQAALKRLNIKNIEWTNQAKSNLLGFGLAQFTDDDGKLYHLGKYFQAISANRLENRFSNDLPGGYRLQSKAAVKERSGYKPTDILTKLDDLKPEDIYKQIVAKFGEGSDEAVATRTFLDTNTYPMRLPLGKMNFDAFTNYFCEILQPIALVQGKLMDGNAKEAEKNFLGSQGFTTCSISFGTDKTQGLTDSMLTNPSGAAIGISSKAKAGAKASAKNLDDKIRELQGTDEGRDIISKFPQEVKILRAIVEGGYDGGPLSLAVDFKIINEEERKQIMSLRKLGPQKIVGQGLLSPRLEEMYSTRNVKDPSRVVPFFHILASVAYRVAEHVNENTDFSKAASAILNHGAFIQVYTRARQQPGMIVLDKFEGRYPSEAVTGVLLAADKSYFSTGNKGNFTFQILKNGATMTDVEAVRVATEEPPPAPAKPPVATGQLRTTK